MIDYRTIARYCLFLDDKITVLVGANESGKTNIIEAVEQLIPDKVLKKSDTKINSESYSKNILPKLIFTFDIIDDDFHNDLADACYSFEKNRILIVEKGGENNDFNIKSPRGDLRYRKRYKNISQEEIEIPLAHSKQTYNSEPEKSFTDYKLDKKSILKLIKENKLQILSEDETKNIAEEEVKNAIDEYLPKIYKWEFTEDYYIPQNIEIDKLINNKDEYRSVYNLFKLAGVENLEEHLKRDSEYAHNFVRQKAAEITKVIRKSWKQNKNLSLIIHFKDKWLEFLIKEKGYEIAPEKRSEGLKWFLSFLINFQADAEDLANNIILLDQPGSKLHPGGQKDFVNRLNYLGEYNQVIYSTHSPFMIQKTYPERVKLLIREDDDTKIINKVSEKEIISDDVLRQALGYVASDISPIADKNLVIEGDFDRNIINSFVVKLARIGVKLDIDNLALVPAKGASKVYLPAEYIKSNNLRVLCLFDNDEKGRKEMEQCKKKKVLDKKEILSINMIKKDAETMEDLLPPRLMEDICNSFCNSFSPKGQRKFKLNPEMPIMIQMNKFFSNRLKKKFDMEEKVRFSEEIFRKFKKYKIQKTDLEKDLKYLFNLIKLLSKELDLDLLTLKGK